MSEYVVRKVGARLLVSSETLAQIAEARAAAVAWGALPLEERVAREAEWRRAQDDRRAANVAAHAGVMEAVESARSWIVPVAAG